MAPVASEFGDRLHIDLLNMPTSIEGHDTTLTAVNAATGFVFAKACKDETSSTVTSILLNTIIPYFGCPKTIVTDFGEENKNQGVSHLLDYFHIKHITCSRAHPQSNGTFTDQNLWHLLLPMCQLLLNSTKSSSGNYSPFFFTFFWHARLPYSAILGRRVTIICIDLTMQQYFC